MATVKKLLLLIALPASALAFDINSGGTFSGSWSSVNVNTSSPVTIKDSTITGNGTLIDLADHANLTIKDSKLIGKPPSSRGETQARAIHGKRTAKLVIENNLFENTAGIRVDQLDSGATVTILRNYVKNIIGQKGNGSGGYLGSRNFSARSFFQTDLSTDLGNSEIAWNYVLNEPFKSRVEDTINIHRSGASSGKLLRIHDNFIDGGYPWIPSEKHNGGCFVTDGSSIGGSTLTSNTVPHNIKIYDNQCIRYVANGIGLAAGHDIEAYGNRVISSNKRNGTTWTGGNPIGFYVWPWAPEVKPFFNNVSAHDNYVGFNDPEKGRNDYYTPNCSGNCSNNKKASGNLNDEENAEYAIWNQKIVNVQIGPRSDVPSSNPSKPSGVNIQKNTD